MLALKALPAYSKSSDLEPREVKLSRVTAASHTQPPHEPAAPNVVDVSTCIHSLFKSVETSGFLGIILNTGSLSLSVTVLDHHGSSPDCAVVCELFICNTSGLSGFEVQVPVTKSTALPVPVAKQLIGSVAGAASYLIIAPSRA